jgi:2-dehydropantoate 2-reductase
MPETIGIVGGGALGTLLMTRLSAAGIPVRAVVRNPARIERLTRDLPQVAHSREASELHGVPLLFLCIKAYDTEAAAGALRALQPSGTAVCSLQNGWGNLEILESALPGVPLLAGATSLGAYLDDEGTLHASFAGKTRIAPWAATRPERAEEAVGVLAAAGLAAETSDDARAILWRKLALNAAVNPLTAITGCPNGALLEEPSLLRLAERAALEATHVGERLGSLPGPWDPLPALHALLSETRTNLSSMAQDLARGRRTEIDAIAGAVVSAAERTGASAPVLRALLTLVRAAETYGRG